jgi:hypothetical protein
MKCQNHYFQFSKNNRATHLNKCLIRNKNKNETLLVNVSNSTVKNIFENGMIPKLMQKRPTTVWNIYFGPIDETVI